jgi:hypothetical protein
MDLTLVKTYGLVNRIIFGFLAIDCLGHNCQIINLIIPFSELSMLHLIIILRVVAFNWQFWNITNSIYNRRVARFTNIEPNQTTLHRNRIYDEIQDIKLEQQIFAVWLTVLELIVFTLANITSNGYQLIFVMLGIFINSSQEI